MKTVVVIPALDEAATLAGIITALRSMGLSDVIVVDGGSRDDSVGRAQAAGATVIVERRRGYGRACLAGARQARALGAEVIAFMNGAGAEDPNDLPTLLAPIMAGESDLVIGARRPLEKGALRPLQLAGNRLATWLIWRRHGHRYTDLGSMRAIRFDALERLAQREQGHGWPVEMQLRALACGLRVAEVPTGYRRRRAGQSKVSGNWRGALQAGVTILRLVLTSPKVAA